MPIYLNKRGSHIASVLSCWRVKAAYLRVSVMHLSAFDFAFVASYTNGMFSKLIKSAAAPEYGSQIQHSFITSHTTSHLTGIAKATRPRVTTLAGPAIIMPHISKREG